MSNDEEWYVKRLAALRATSALRDALNNFPKYSLAHPEAITDQEIWYRKKIRTLAEDAITATQPLTATIPDRLKGTAAAASLKDAVESLQFVSHNLGADTEIGQQLADYIRTKARFAKNTVNRYT